MPENKILLIADALDVARIAISNQFKGIYEVLEAADGKTALDIIKKQAGELDIILMNVDLPEISGYEILDYMSESGLISKIPVVAASFDINDEKTALAKGAWDFIDINTNSDTLTIRTENVVNRITIAKITAQKAELDAKTQALRYLNDMPTAFFALKLENGLLVSDYCNKAFISDFGRDESSALNNLALAAGPDFLNNLTETALSPERHQNSNSLYITYNNKYYSIYYYSPRINYCACLIHDITENKRLQERNIRALERENKLLQETAVQSMRYELIMSQTGAVVFDFDLSKGTSYISSNIADYSFRYDIFSIGSTIINPASIHPRDRSDFISEFTDRILVSHSESVTSTARFEQNNGSFIWCRISASCSYSEDGSLKHFFGTILNVNNEQEYLNRLRREAEFDITTGIFNKQTFFMETRRLLDQYVDDDFCIIRFDIDNFKLINELFGHDEGDKVLTHIASSLENILMNYSRRSYGRLEADIFCICIKKEDTPNVLEMVTHITDNYPLDFDMLITTGIYEITERNLSIDVMCDRAHLASKTIKGNYITRTAYFDEKLHESILNEQVIISIMNTALEEKQFIVYYQPKFHISNNSICGAEALVRWIHPERGMIYPDKFIPVFERSGFIMKLDEYVWERVCSDMRENLDLGKKVLPVSVNISKINLYNPRLCDTLIGLVEKYNIPVGLFQLELTESAFTDNKFVLINVMERLKNYGFTVMMDDFGSGYSSLNMLKEIPVDVLKIDLHFLSGDDESGKGGKILSSVITMAKWLNMHVITEGIETKSQVDFLRSIGCEDGQGYYFAKPMTRADYEKLVETGADQKEECYLAAKEFDIEELWNPNSKLSVLFNTIMSAFGIFEMNSGKVQPIRLNDQFFEMIGCSRGSITDLQADSVFNAYTDQDKNVVNALFRTALMTKNISESTFRRSMPNGDFIRIQTKVRYIAGNEENSVYFVVMNDVTKEYRYEEQLKAAHEQLQKANEQLRLKYNYERQFRDAVNASNILYCESDLTDNIVTDVKGIYAAENKMRVNSNYDKTAAAFIRHSVHPDDTGIAQALFRRDKLIAAFESGQTELSGEYRSDLESSGEYVWLETVCTIFRSDINGHICFSASIKNIDNKKQAELGLRENNNKDLITGLYNTAAFQSKVGERINNSSECSFVIVDIDNFRRLNDNFGRTAADHTLKGVADSINSFLPENAFAARSGGDEFLIFIDGDITPEKASDITENICKQIGTISPDDGKTFISASAGITVCSCIGASFDMLYRNADRALYFAKRKGKNRYAVYSDDITAERPKILVADDLGMHRQILINLLSSKYNIIEAADGVEALEIIRSQSDISLIILDNIMPKMTGLELLEIIKNEPVAADIPVIMVTMCSEPEIKLKALDLGVTYFIDKPYDSEIVRKLTDNIIMQK